MALRLCLSPEQLLSREKPKRDGQSEFTYFCPLIGCFLWPNSNAGESGVHTKNAEREPRKVLSQRSNPAIIYVLAKSISRRLTSLSARSGVKYIAV